MTRRAGTPTAGKPKERDRSAPARRQPRRTSTPLRTRTAATPPRYGRARGSLRWREPIERTRSELSPSAHLDRSSHHDVDLDSGHLRHRAEGAPDDRWDRLRLRRRKVNEVMSEPVRTTEPDEPLSGRARREQRKTRDRPKDLVVGDEVEGTGDRRRDKPAIRFMDLLTKRVTVAFTLGAELGAV
jgi:hypothetical protein